jgi:hypothetical protein
MAVKVSKKLQQLRLGNSAKAKGLEPAKKVQIFLRGLAILPLIAQLLR